MDQLKIMIKRPINSDMEILKEKYLEKIMKKSLQMLELLQEMELFLEDLEQVMLKVHNIQEN